MMGYKGWVKSANDLGNGFINVFLKSFVLFLYYCNIVDFDFLISRFLFAGSYIAKHFMKNEKKNGFEPQTHTHIRTHACLLECLEIVHA